MLIAEALAERKDALKRIAEYPAKVAEVAVWDEDDEKPKKAEYDDLVASVAADLIRVEQITLAINVANAALTVKTEWGSMTLMKSIARRVMYGVSECSSGTRAALSECTSSQPFSSEPSAASPEFAQCSHGFSASKPLSRR